jgi:hypothetical protein
MDCGDMATTGSSIVCWNGARMPGRALNQREDSVCERGRELRERRPERWLGCGARGRALGSEYGRGDCVRGHLRGGDGREGGAHRTGAEADAQARAVQLMPPVPFRPLRGRAAVGGGPHNGPSVSQVRIGKQHLDGREADDEDRQDRDEAMQGGLPGNVAAHEILRARN